MTALMANRKLAGSEQLAFAETIKDEIVSAINKNLSTPITGLQEKLILCALILGKTQGLKSKEIEQICGLNQTAYGEEIGKLRAIAFSSIDTLNYAGKANSRTYFLDAIGMTAAEFISQAEAVAEDKEYPHQVTVKPTKRDVDNLTGKTVVAQLEALIPDMSPADIVYARQRLSVL